MLAWNERPNETGKALHVRQVLYPFYPHHSSFNLEIQAFSNEKHFEEQPSGHHEHTQQLKKYNPEIHSESFWRLPQSRSLLPYHLPASRENRACIHTSILSLHASISLNGCVCFYSLHQIYCLNCRYDRVALGWFLWLPAPMFMFFIIPCPWG